MLKQFHPVIYFLIQLLKAYQDVLYYLNDLPHLLGVWQTIVDSF
jgi:hypothetical protein